MKTPISEFRSDPKVILPTSIELYISCALILVLKCACEGFAGNLGRAASASFFSLLFGFPSFNIHGIQIINIHAILVPFLTDRSATL
jgi:hypothetical protein